jgi:four helix bundle protein
MSRDYTKLRVFVLADDLVVEIYLLTRSLPDEEKYGLQTQLRRAAVSVPTNIVEGSVRRTERSYLKYLETSLGSACEVRYLLRLCMRLHCCQTAPLANRYTIVIKQLESLMFRVAATAKTRSTRKRPPTA